MKKFIRSLFDRVDVAPLAAFRVIYGVMLLIEVINYVSTGKVRNQWIIPINNFTYWPFDFLRPLEGEGMLYLFYLLGFLAFFIAIGLFYRICIVLFCIGFGYVALLDQSFYLNHFYLITLLALIMIFLPMNHIWSIDSLLFLKNKKRFVSSWCLWLLRFTVALPYVFGALAKITPDWLRGQPMSMWVSREVNTPIIGDLMAIKGAGLVMSYAGIFIDLLIVPALMWPKSRKWALGFIVLFHLINATMYPIGIFPWLMLFSSVIFFESEWLNKYVFKSKLSKPTLAVPEFHQWSWKQKSIIGLLACYMAYHVLMPFRHFLIPGNVHWTEEGEYYSWHMKLKSKYGQGKFYVVNKALNEKREIPIRNYLTPRQERIMLFKPDMIWQFAQMVKKKYKENGTDVAVNGDVQVTLNGREFQQLFSPSLDLTLVPRPGWGVHWINPLTIPLDQKLKAQ